MSSTGSRDRGALIALGMALVAIAVNTWISQPSNPTQVGIAQLIVAVTSVATVVFSGVAAYFLYRTLHETRKTAEAAIAANEILRCEQRPWLKLTVEKINFANKDRTQITVAGEVTNIGKNPAEAVLCLLGRRSGAGNMYGDDVRKIAEEIIAAAEQDLREGIALLPDESHPFRMSGTVEPLADGHVAFVGVVYRSTSIASSGITMKGYRIGKWNEYPFARHAR